MQKKCTFAHNSNKSTIYLKKRSVQKVCKKFKVCKNDRKLANSAAFGGEPHRWRTTLKKKKGDVMAEYVYDTFPYPFLIRNIQATGEDNFRVFFFPREYTRLIRYIRSGERMKKLLDEKLGGDDSV